MTLLATILMLSAAVASPLRSPSDYIFEYPKMTNHISGKVMGENGGYSAMRYEDICFLREGFLERLAYVGDVSEFKTNSIPLTINNAASLLLPGGYETLRNIYISETNRLSTSTRLVTKDEHGHYTPYTPSSTNKTHSKIVRLNTGVVDPYDIKWPYTNLTFVTQTMTNLSQNVFTNLYTFYSNTLDTVLVSNDFSIADFCMDDYIYPNDDPPAVMSSMKAAYSKIYSAEIVTNAYALLKSMYRTPPIETSAIPTNATKITSTYDYGYTEETGSYTIGPKTTYTDTIQSIGTYYCYNYYRDEDDFVEKSSEHTTYEMQSSYLESDIPNSLLNQIKTANVFVYASVSYSEENILDRHENTNMTFSAVVPLGHATAIKGPVNLLFRFSASIDDICSKICARSGIQKLVFNVITSNREQIMTSSVNRFFLQIDYKARTSLPGWPPND